MARLLSLLLPAAMCLYANFQGLQQILVPMQVEAIDPKGKIGNIALLTMICAVTGVLGLMAGGAGSDATRGRWGRRSPWLVGMAILSALLTTGLGLQSGLLGMAVLCGALWFALNAFQGALLAVTPDRVPDSRRGVASSVFAVAGPLGAVLGVDVAAMAPSEAGHAALAVLLLATTATFVLFAREAPWQARRIPEAKLPGRRLRLSWGLLRSFSSRDFSLAYAFRLLMFIAQYSITNFLFYILQDRIGVANLPGGNAQLAAGTLNSLRTVATVGAIVVGFAIANRTERRKVFAQALRGGDGGGDDRSGAESHLERHAGFRRPRRRRDGPLRRDRPHADVARAAEPRFCRPRPRAAGDGRRLRPIRRAAGRRRLDKVARLQRPLPVRGARHAGGWGGHGLHQGRAVGGWRWERFARACWTGRRCRSIPPSSVVF